MSTNIMNVPEGQYSTMLAASSAIEDQPTIKDVLRSLRDVLSNVSRLHGADLFGLSDNGRLLHLLETDKEVDGPLVVRDPRRLFRWAPRFRVLVCVLKRLRNRNRSFSRT